jgi:hypothetical protein
MNKSGETAAGGQARRLRIKTQEQRLATLAVQGAGMSPWAAKELVGVVREVFFSEPEDRPLRSGQIRYECVESGEGAGKALKECRLTTVVLTQLVPEDRTLLGREGHVALRQERIVRLTEEARDQGGLLTQEDLAQLLCCDVRTVRRDIAEFRKRGVMVATRGQQKDIGTSVTHRGVAVRLWLEGHEPLEVARRINHSLGAVERYIQNFSRVVFLKLKRFAPLQIALTVGISLAHVDTCLQLWAEYGQRKEYRRRFEEIRTTGETFFLAEDEKKGILSQPANTGNESRRP